MYEELDLVPKREKRRIEFVLQVMSYFCSFGHHINNILIKLIAEMWVLIKASVVEHVDH